MTDVLSQAQRSYCMSRIKGKNTKPETALRKALWRLGFRYRVKSQLPGKPDIVFPSLKTVVFVDGCFWHKCPDHYIHPKTRADFWKIKIEENVERDKKIDARLEHLGWLVIRVWEHEIKKSLADCVHRTALILNERKSRSLNLLNSQKSMR